MDKEVRMVRIDKGYGALSTANKMADIEAMTLENAIKEKYYAISYTWGDVPPWKLGWRNSNGVHELDHGIVSFNAFSYKAIHGILLKVSEYLRTNTALAPKYFWIDAICIMQNDEVERRKTISIMDQIFKNAEKIIAIPDLGSDNTELDIDIVLNTDDTYHGGVLASRTYRKHLEKWFSRSWVAGEIMGGFGSSCTDNSMLVIMKYAMFCRGSDITLLDENEIMIKHLSREPLTMVTLRRVCDAIPKDMYYGLKDLATISIMDSDYSISNLIFLIAMTKARECPDKPRAITAYTADATILGGLNRFSWCRTNENILEELLLTDINNPAYKHIKEYILSNIQFNGVINHRQDDNTIYLKSDHLIPRHLESSILGETNIFPKNIKIRKGNIRSSISFTCLAFTLHCEHLRKYVNLFEPLNKMFNINTDILVPFSRFSHGTDVRFPLAIESNRYTLFHLSKSNSDFKFIASYTDIFRSRDLYMSKCKHLQQVDISFTLV